MAKPYHSRKYTLNELFFSRWTPTMAYVLGFWFADGYMRKEKSYRVSFCSNDLQILEQIRNALGSSSPISESRRDKSLNLLVHSRRLYEDLTHLGGFRKKSTTVGFPNIPQKFICDFIRGYFDGDGSVFRVNYTSTKDKKPRSELRCNFTSGSLKFLSKLMDILVGELGLAKKILGSYNNGHSLKLGYGTADTQKLLKFMYYPGFPIGLARKARFGENIY